jgi:hypothetical protein
MPESSLKGQKSKKSENGKDKRPMNLESWPENLRIFLDIGWF